MTEHTHHEPKPRPPSAKVLLIAGAAAVALAAVVLATGLSSRAASLKQTQTWSDQHATPTVALAQLSTDTQGTTTLPAVVQPFRTAQIYARVSGYLKDWKRDIGAPVHAGDLLGEIEAPELDQQLEQARGDLTLAQANANLANLTAQRWSALFTHQAVSQQATDEKTGDAKAKAAAVAAAQANVRRLSAMTAYESVRAPFDGLVTARKVDVGALINTGVGSQELFEVSNLHQVRIYVQVPQTMSAQLKPGEDVTFQAPQFEGQTFKAKVFALSHLLDQNSRTMQVELLADNPGDRLAAGSYVQVQFGFEGAAGAVRMPSTALIMDIGGPKAAVVGSDGKVQIRNIKVGRDFGSAVEVTSGIRMGDWVIDSPPETLKTGEAVQVGRPAPAMQQGG